MRANQLMSKEVVCLRPIETVGAIMTILRDYDHNCFPVVEDRDHRVLLGVVYRYCCRCNRPFGFAFVPADGVDGAASLPALLMHGAGLFVEKKPSFVCPIHPAADS